MKIVISSNTSWSIYNFRLNLAKTLKKRGYEVVIVAPHDEYIEYLKKKFKFYEISIDSKGTNPSKDIKTVFDYYKIYKRIKPDIVLNFTIKPNIYGTMICNLLGIKTINNITGLGTLFIKENFASKIAKFLYKLSLKKADFIFFQNRDDFELFGKLRLIDDNKCGILPGSGVDIYRFKPIKIKKDDDVFKFLLIARMIKDKGVFEYIEAAKIIRSKHSNVEFLLLGAVGVDNPTAIPKEKIKEWEDKGLVKYLGMIADVRQEIAKADCVVLPSYREGTSRVLLESAAMAKPIITTNVPGCRDVVDDGINGFLCEVKNSKDLANRMEKMISLSEGERNKIGKNGRKKIIKEFDEKIVIDKYIEVIDEILKGIANKVYTPS